MLLSDEGVKADVESPEFSLVAAWPKSRASHDVEPVELALETVVLVLPPSAQRFLLPPIPAGFGGGLALALS